MTSPRGRALPIMVFVMGLLASLVAALTLAQTERGRQEARFHGLANSAAAAVQSRMLAQLTLLRGTAGFFNASDQVRREDFRRYVARLGLEQNYPGVLGIGYAAYAADGAALDRLSAQARAQGEPSFTLRPPGDRPDYSAILYLEPMNRLNAAAIGFDMMSEATRRTAMESARRQNMAVLSGKVRLVQEIDPVKQPGFLIYVPLYRSGRDPDTLYGWVYSPLRAHDLFRAIFAGRDMRELVVEIYDERVAADRLLFASAEYEPGTLFQEVRYLELAGRRWALRISSAPAFASSSPLAIAALVGAGGALISLLLAFLMLQQVRAKERTEREVRLRTAELQQSNERLLAEARAREEAEAKIVQMQKMEAIGQLAGGVAHDFNNMLTVVIGNLDIAARRKDQPDRIQRSVEYAREAAEKAAELTQRLLAFGRQQALLPTVLDANKLVAGMSELIRRSIGQSVRLETVLAGGLWRVHADSAQLENAILNLAINARDAMAEGGSLTIETANCRLDEAYVRGQDGLSPGQFVLIAVSDTGEGMTPEVRAKALDPFFTTKEVGRGTGLGLSQVYGFVKQSGGHLAIYSEPGEGTTVKIYLPRYRGPEVAEEAPEAGSAEPLAPARPGEVVLVVEDDPRVREMSVGTLQELGYKVLEAPEGAEGLRLLDEHREVTLLFTDVVMPGMSGRRLADEALARRPDLKVLFTTGYTRNAIVHHGRLDEGVALLQKPFTPSALAQKVRQQLDT